MGPKDLAVFYNFLASRTHIFSISGTRNFLSFFNSSSSPSLWSFLALLPALAILQCLAARQLATLPLLQLRCRSCPSPSELPLLPSPCCHLSPQYIKEARKDPPEKDPTAHCCNGRTVQRVLWRSSQPSAHTAQEGALVPNSHFFLQHATGREAWIWNI